MKSIAIAAIAVLGLAACQAAETEAPKGAEATAAVDGAPAGSAEAVQRILAIPLMQRCAGDWPGHPDPTAHQVIDLGGGAFAVMTECHPDDGKAPWKSLHVQGADGVLKAQSLILFNGPETEFEEGHDWEPSVTSEAVWDPATKEFVWSHTFPADDGDTATHVRTMRWRWDGSKIAMVSAVRVTHAAPGAPATNAVTGWPAAGKIDPTPAAVPV